MIARVVGVAALACGMLVSTSAAAQRPKESHTFADGEGKLMAYYGAALLFTPAGAPDVRPPGSLTISGELGYIPPLNQDQRTFNGQKTESTNLLSVFPRPRLTLGLPAGFSLEASWLPPITAGGVKPNVFSLALASEIGTWAGTRFTGRIAGQAGTVTAAITCNNSLQAKSVNDSLYYHFVCHDHESADRFQPRIASAELMVQRWNDGAVIGRLGAPYAGVGLAVEDTKFDVVVYNFDGSRDLNHPILSLSTARPYGYIGTTYRAIGRMTVGAQGLYAPGSLFTGRVMATYVLRGGR